MSAIGQRLDTISDGLAAAGACMCTAPKCENKPEHAAWEALGWLRAELGTGPKGASDA